MAPKIPKALARSLGLVKVSEIRARAEGASRAPKTPCPARGQENAQVRGGSAQCGGQGEADQAYGEGPLAAQEVAQASTEDEQSAEGQAVGGDDPLAAAVGEVQGVLGGGQRDVHDRAV